MKHPHPLATSPPFWSLPERAIVYPVIAGIVLLYVAAAEAAKRWFYRHARKDGFHEILASKDAVKVLGEAPDDLIRDPAV